MVTNKTISDLIAQQSSHLITLTMPAYSTGEETKKNKITFKNLIQKAEKMLEESGLKPEDIQERLSEAKALLEQPLFWAHQDQGFAAYLDGSNLQTFKLPYPVKEQVYLKDHFLITPLLPMLALEGTFGILALSRKSLRLLHGTRHGMTDITPDGISRSEDQYLEVTPEKQLQFHTGAEGQNARFFGHGSGAEDKKVIVEQYFREVEKGITEKMNALGDPLVLAGLEENLALYRSFQKYGRMLDESVTGNPDEMMADDLKDAGFEKIKGYFLKDLTQSLEAFSESPDGKVSNNMSDIIEATFHGRSDVIFLSTDESHFGKVDPESGAVHYAHEPGSEDIDLVNWLAIQGLKTGSSVFMLQKSEMPLHANVAARFRY